MARADLVVTNSWSEARLLAADAVTPLPAIRVAHSGVDPRFFAGSVERGRSLLGLDRFVLCIGRVEPIKNQLTVARVMRSVPRRLLPHVYAAADVHVLPSWYETTGLATLEALAAGTPCVAGRSPCVEDYFEGGVRLHRPGDERGLRAGILDALDEPRGRGRELAARFTWARTAEELLDAYRR